MRPRIYSYPNPDETETEGLADQATHMEEEARMILPGIQALFGFQLIAVFNQRFEALRSHEQSLHLAAIFFTALSMAFVLAPAAYHRQAEPGGISGFFCRLGSIALSIALAPLLLGICADLFVITSLVTRKPALASGLSLAMLLLYSGFWFGFPQLVARAKRRRYDRSSLARHRAG